MGAVEGATVQDGRARGRRADPAARRELEPDGADRQVAERQQLVARILGVHARMRDGDGLATRRRRSPTCCRARASCASRARRVPFAAGQGLFVPARTWHAVANTGAEDVIMVFGFPHPDYPPTERKEAQA